MHEIEGEGDLAKVEQDGGGEGSLQGRGVAERPDDENGSDGVPGLEAGGYGREMAEAEGAVAEYSAWEGA